jgi:hypothetical protein
VRGAIPRNKFRGLRGVHFVYLRLKPAHAVTEEVMEILIGFILGLFAYRVVQLMLRVAEDRREARDGAASR